MAGGLAAIAVSRLSFSRLGNSKRRWRTNELKQPTFKIVTEVATQAHILDGLLTLPGGGAAALKAAPSSRDAMTPSSYLRLSSAYCYRLHPEE
jgi:hypothetical protein